MEKIFLSYTYNPHPVHAQETERLVRAARMVIESLGLRVSDGVDLGGRAIDAEIENRILDADALVAVATPQDDGNGNLITPPYVDDEYKLAKSKGKHAIRILHQALPAKGMGQHEEYILHAGGAELESILKLMRTVSIWKRQEGKPRKLEVDPAPLGGRYSHGAFGHQFEYQLLDGMNYSEWKPATLWYEPGVSFAYLPGVPEQAKVKLRLSLNGEIWESPYCNPMGKIVLERKQP